MSRLIFEGDTNKRFGEEIPRPFIEQVRAYDNGLEVDIAFYFKVPQKDEDVEAFISDLKNESKFSQSIVLSFIDKQLFDRVSLNNDFKPLLKFMVFNPLEVADTNSKNIVSNNISFADFVNGNIVSSDRMRTSITTSGFSFEPREPEISLGITDRSILEGAPDFGSEPTFSDGRPGQGFFAELGSPDFTEPTFDNYFSGGSLGTGFDFSADEQEVDFSVQGVGIKDDFYNLEGTRFAKIYGTLVSRYNLEKELYACCFVKNGLDKEFYQGQTSDLSYEKVLNRDRTISSEPVVAFLEQDGNFYYQSPLMSLSKVYHKTDDYGHKELIKQFSEVLGAYVSDESEMLLKILNTEANNPRLLLLLKEAIDGFTEKSPVTNIGRLYSQIASNIVLADTFVSRQEVLNKRQFSNTKIKDFRQTLLPTLVRNESIGGFYKIATTDSFLPKPLISRQVFPFFNSEQVKVFSLDMPPRDVLKYFKLETNAYYFFDFEKLLNYKSEISRFLNPYNVEQIFGKGSLSNFFKFKICTFSKQPRGMFRPDLLREKKYILDYLYNEDNTFTNKLVQSDLDPDSNFHRLEGSDGTTRAGNFGNTTITFDPRKKEILYSSLMQRGFDTHEGLNGYKLSLFEIQDYQKVSNTESYFENLDIESVRFVFTIVIQDDTMQFYDIYIRQKIFSLLEQITRYLDFADDFCSYNNIDNRFNDFFIEAVNQEFDQPYPWVEAPAYYYLFKEMLESSLNQDLTRKFQGILMDLDSIRQVSLNRAKLIRPETGNLKDLQDFHLDLLKLVQEFFLKGRGLDRNNQIYRDDGSRSESYNLINESTEITLSRRDDFNRLDVSSDFDLEALEDYNNSRCVDLLLEKERINKEISDKNYAYQQRLEDAAEDMSGAGLDTFDMPPEPDLSELTTALSRVEEEISQRKCNEFEQIGQVVKCRDLQKRWKDYRALYTIQKELFEKGHNAIYNSNFGFGLREELRSPDGDNYTREEVERLRRRVRDTKRSMEAVLAEYQLSGCVELIGRANGPSESLEKDLQDAGITE